MNIKCIVVDDEVHARKVLEKFISDIPHLELVKSCKNALEAMQVLNEQNIDAMFLDINMPKVTGLNFLENLRHPPAVVITTAYREYAVEAFDLDVIDYLHKPIPFPRFLKAVSKVEEKLKSKTEQTNISSTPNTNKQEEFIFIKADKKTFKLNFDDIVYIEGLGDFIKIHVKEKTIVSKLTIKKMEELLPSDIFPRIHKSFIISLKSIVAIEGNQVEIGNTKIPIGQIYRKSFMDIINSFLKK